MVPIDSYYISSPAIVLCVKSLADPRFPRRGGQGAPAPVIGAKTYYLARFLPKTA